MAKEPTRPAPAPAAPPPVAAPAPPVDLASLLAPALDGHAAPAVALDGGAATLTYPTLAAYHARTHADLAALRALLAVAAVEVDALDKNPELRQRVTLRVAE